MTLRQCCMGRDTPVVTLDSMLPLVTQICSVCKRKLGFIEKRLHTYLDMCSTQNKKVLSLRGPAESEWDEHTQAACNSLKQDNLIAVPTDTIYGIAGLAQSPLAVQRIYEIKNRRLSNPISISVGDVAQVSKWGKVTIPQQLLEELLPGPVTVVFERTVDLNPALNPGTSLVGIRVPDDGFVQEVARFCGEPLALTSANVSGAASTLSVMEFENLWPQLDLVFDGGVLGHNAQSRAGSTVVDLSSPGLFTIIRPGMAHQRTKSILEQYGLNEKVKTTNS